MRILIICDEVRLTDSYIDDNGFGVDLALKVPEVKAALSAGFSVFSPFMVIWY